MSPRTIFFSLYFAALAALPSPTQAQNDAPAGRSRYVLLIDKSGSMATEIDEFKFTRLDVAKDALKFLITVLPADTELTIVAFDETAQVAFGPSVIQSAELNDPERIAAQAALQNIEPKGQTSIGSALKTAYASLGIDSSLGNSQGDTTVLVVTDGKENFAPMIPDIAQFACRHFAIGIGKPEDVNAAALTDLTNSSNGFFVLSGDPGVHVQLTLEKRFLQILQGFAELQAVQDPSAMLPVDGGVDIPFMLSEFDQKPMIVLNSPYLGVELTLTSPDGLKITAANAKRHGIEFLETGVRTFVRFDLRNNPNLKPGKWIARCGGSRNAGNFWAPQLSAKHQQAWAKTSQEGKMPCMINMYSDSPLKLRTQVVQDKLGPGAPIKVRMTLTEQNHVAPGQLAGVVKVTPPGGTEEKTQLRRLEPGVYEAEFPGAAPGVYSMLVRVEGKTVGGLDFSREELLQATVLAAEPVRPVLDLLKRVNDKTPTEVQVVIQDAVTRQPIPGATLRIGQNDFPANGAIAVDASLIPGAYPITARAPGYAVTQSSLNVAAKTMRVTILLQPEN